MLLNVEDLRKLNQRSPEMSYMIVEKCIEKYFTDLLRYQGILHQNYILIDSTYLPWQYLSQEVIEKIVYKLEKELGYFVVVQKMDNDSYNGFKPGDVIQMLLFDPLNFDKDEVNVAVNSVHHQTLYSTFSEYNNIDGHIKKSEYLDAKDYIDKLLGTTNKQMLDTGEKQINFDTDINITFDEFNK